MDGGVERERFHGAFHATPSGGAITPPMPITERAREVLLLQGQLGQLAMQVPPPPEAAADRHLLGYQEMGLSFHHATSIASHLERHGSNLAASAFALARPMLETLQRGWWFAAVATEEQAAAFLATDQFPGPGVAAVGRAIDAVPPFAGTAFFTGLDQVEWTAYHSFTHGGLFALDAYANRPHLVPDYDPDKLLALLDNAQRMSGVAALGMAWIGRIYAPERTGPVYRAIHALGPQLGQ